MRKFSLKFDRNKKYFALSQNVAIAIILILITYLIENAFILTSGIPKIFLCSTALATQILSTLTGAFLAITTFTFSTIMVVLTMYSSNYTPRVVENFLSAKITMKVIGVFLGGFLYSIVSLFLIDINKVSSLFISPFVAIVYSIMSMILFIRFIFFVSNRIQDTNLIKQLYMKSNEVIDSFVSDHRTNERMSDIDFSNYTSERVVYFDKNGYLEIIKFNELLRLKSENDIHIYIIPKIGEYLTRNMIVAKIFYNEGVVDEEIIEKTKKIFLVEDKKFTRTDYMFTIQKLVEISTRAISPGINDPNTATNCIRIIGILIGKLSEVSGNYTKMQSEDSNITITYEDFNLEEDLYDIFYQIIHYGQSDLSVVITVFEALKTALRVSSDTNKEALIKFSNYVYEATIKNYHHIYEKKKILSEIEYIKGFSYN